MFNWEATSENNWIFALTEWTLFHSQLGVDISRYILKKYIEIYIVS